MSVKKFIIIRNINIVNEGSYFGSVLDMVTDRFATACLVIILSHLYFPFRHICMMLIILDISSHWFRVVSSLLAHKSHKEIQSESTLLKLYYHNRFILGFTCLGNELFYIFLYMMYFYPNLRIIGTSMELFSVAVILCFPVFLFKQVLNIIQLKYSAIEIVSMEKKKK